MLKKLHPALLSRSKTHLARQALQIAMSDYSENYYAAGWMNSIEYELWDDVLKLRSGKRHTKLGVLRQADNAFPTAPPYP